MERKRRAHPEWVLMSDKGVSTAVIARLNDVSPDYVREYVRRRGEALRGGPAPVRLVLHDRPRPSSRPDPDRRWRARLEELDRFLLEHQRRPHASRSDDSRHAGSEWSLAHWLITQRSHLRAGRLPEHRERGLDRVLPSWRLDDRSIENEAYWRLRLVELLRFLHDQGRFPKSSEVPGDRENSLAVWVYAQQGAYRAGTLEPERVLWLNRQAPMWRPGPSSATASRLAARSIVEPVRTQASPRRLHQSV